MKNVWHAISLWEVLSRLQATKDGLTSVESSSRLEKFGRNVLPEEAHYSKIKLFLGQFRGLLIYILLVAIFVSFLLRHYSDAFFILAVLLINTLVSFYQENKANQSLLALKKMVRIRARVLRDGYEKEIDSEELVSGDVVFLKSGDKVPADCRILEARGLRVNEASLTGESLAVFKTTTDELPESTLLPDKTNMVFMGTIVEEGRATTVVVATGIKTELGEVVSLLKETKEGKTPLQRKIAVLSRLTGAFIIFVIFVVIFIGYFTGQSITDIFITSLALAVSAIPEGLLPAITIILVLGMRRILKQNGLVRQLVATETLGSVTAICTDKTGTLTEGKMLVSHILTSNKELLSDNLSKVSPLDLTSGMESHVKALRIATLASEAFVENPESELEDSVVRGRPTERALLLAGMQAGLNKHELEKYYPVLDRIDFESGHKFSATFHKDNHSKFVLYVVGAPEEIIARSTSLDVDGDRRGLHTEEANRLLTQLETLAKKGLRVVACAHREYDVLPKYESLIQLVVDLSLVGFIALKDPLRREARESIAITKRAGIRTIIVTGDHRLTAETIAGEIGLSILPENIIEGKELELIDDYDLKERVRKLSLYVRVSPRHKLRIVKALQANGEIVAMLGDGVNDAPALKSADIGVAVGSGTDVAKEVADLVLLDDNFGTIVKAVEQGRVIFENVRKVFVYLIADDFSELFLFLSSLIMGLPLPLLPAQILWINLIEDSFPNMALTTEQETVGVMDDKPRHPKEPILNGAIKQWMMFVFLVSGLAALLLFWTTWNSTFDLQKTRTIVFTLMCVDSLVFALSVRSFKRTIFRRDIFSNVLLVGALVVSTILLMAAIYLPSLQNLLATEPLSITEWSTILSIALAEILAIEFFKIKIFNSRAANLGN